MRVTPLQENPEIIDEITIGIRVLARFVQECTLRILDS